MTQKKISPAKAVLDQDKPFVFTHEGKSYRLPNAEKALKAVDGGAFMDALLDEDDNQAQLRFALKALKNSGVDDKALTALRAKPVEEFAEVLGNWMAAAGAGLGE